MTNSTAPQTSNDQINNDATTEPVDAPEAQPVALAPGLIEALAALRAGDPDGVPSVNIRGAYRELNSKGNGSQTYRRVVYPGRRASEWPDCGRLPRLGGYLASERRCSEPARVPVGTLVLDYESQVSRYKASRATLTIAMVTRQEDGKPALEWLAYRALRARPAYVVTLPDGTECEIEREPAR